MAKVFITRRIPENGITALREAGHEIVVSPKDGVLTKQALIAALRADSYDAVLCLLTDTIDAEVYDAAPSAKIFANYAVGFNNIDIEEAKKRSVVVTNTPGALTDAVAEHTMALLLTLVTRTAEGDRFVRAGKFEGWGPLLLLGESISGKTLGLVGAGRIGARVAEMAHTGFGMHIVYQDIAPNPRLDAVGAVYVSDLKVMLSQSDVVSIHVPLLPSTRHLFNKETLGCMKSSAYLINTSRGPVVDEYALVEVLKNNLIAGAALDVFENEPALALGLEVLENVVLTPHIASATLGVREEMAAIAARNIIAVLGGKSPENPAI